MAFLNRVSNLLKHNASNHVAASVSSGPSPLFQAIRGMCSYANTKLFVGGLAWATDVQSLREAFSQHGEVVDARIIEDRETGRSRGFGFVTFGSSEAASSAIKAFDGMELHGRTIRVNFANERPRSGGFGGGGYGGGGYGGGGYGGGGYGGGGGGYGGGGYGGYGRGGGDQSSNYSGGDVGYGGGNQYSGGGGGGGGYPTGGGGGYGSGSSVQSGGDYYDSKPNFGSLLNDDASGAIGGNQEPSGGTEGENLDFGQDKDEDDFATRR